MEKSENVTSRSPKLNVLGFLCAIALLAALRPWPYSYYIFLRWMVCIVAVMFALDASKRGLNWIVWIFASVAILFNPIVPFYLSRHVWQIFDVGAAILFVVAARRNSKK